MFCREWGGLRVERLGRWVERITRLRNELEKSKVKNPRRNLDVWAAKFVFEFVVRAIRRDGRAGRGKMKGRTANRSFIILAQRLSFHRSKQCREDKVRQVLVQTALPSCRSPLSSDRSIPHILRRNEPGRIPALSDGRSDRVNDSSSSGSRCRAAACLLMSSSSCDTSLLSSGGAA